MTSLASRKQLLIAESELNRAHLTEEIATLSARARALAARAKSIGVITSCAAALVAGFTAFKRGQSLAPAGKPSWLQSILKGVGLVSSVWSSFRSPDPDSEDR